MSLVVECCTLCAHPTCPSKYCRAHEEGKCAYPEGEGEHPTECFNDDMITCFVAPSQVIRNKEGGYIVITQSLGVQL